MKLDVSNLKVFIHHEGYALKILMPDGSGNYLHNGNKEDLNETILIRDLLLEQEINQEELLTKEDDRYFRLELRIKDVNGLEQYFHSRKLNLNDIVFEKELLLYHE